MIDIEYEEERQVAALLADRVRRGDPAAESELVERYSRGLRFLLKRRTRDPELAEDLLQETWIIALERLRNDPLEDPCRLAGYLCGVARHLALNELRKTTRRNTTPRSDVIDLIPDDHPGPVRQASRAEVCTHVRKLLGELKQDRDRQILNLFYVREQDKEDICRKLGVNGSHFNRVLFRARQRLRDVVLKEGARSRLKVVRP
jgi:RNA polymerase sigma-70 factor (ECF subfamily)